MIDIQGLYDGLILESTFRGVPFWTVDSRDTAGRRLQKFLFPGQDQAVYQDLGQFDGDIHISGLLVGDDYAHQADLLRNAFQTAGPGTPDTPGWASSSRWRASRRSSAFNRDLSYAWRASQPSSRAGFPGRRRRRTRCRASSRRGPRAEGAGYRLVGASARAGGDDARGDRRR